MFLSRQSPSSCVYGFLVDGYNCRSRRRIAERCFVQRQDVALLLRVLKHMTSSNGVKIQLCHTLPAPRLPLGSLSPLFFFFFTFLLLSSFSSL